MKENDPQLRRAIAVYQNTRNNRKTAIMPCLNGGYYQHHIDYDGLFAWGATSLVDEHTISMLRAATTEKMIKWTKGSITILTKSA